MISQGQTPQSDQADSDGDGLIEIDSLIDLHNMRYDLAGKSYKTGTASVGNSSGCPEAGCIGYELVRDLDFDVSGDGRTWSGNGDDGYTLDSDDHRADYFPVDEDGAGGWLPIGSFADPFAAVFDGNGYSISNLAIHRDQFYIGLFGVIGGATAIRNLGLVENLAYYSGSSGSTAYIGGLAAWQDGSITASYATGVAAGGNAVGSGVFGSLVGRNNGGAITASYATGAAAGGDSDRDRVGGLVGWQSGGAITASYATGAAAGGGGIEDLVGGLVGSLSSGMITASYATGVVAGGGDARDQVGGLVGSIGGLFNPVVVIASYGFGVTLGGEATAGGSPKPPGVDAAAELRSANVGATWNSNENNTLGAWDFGDQTQIPALKYADYDGAGTGFTCDQTPANALCGDLLPGQADVNAIGPSAAAFGDIVGLAGSLKFGRVAIESWSWRQLAGSGVMLSDDSARETTFTVPDGKEPLVFELTAMASDGRQYRERLSIAAKADRDGDGLIEIDSLLELHNMRHDLTGAGYKSGAAAVGNSLGCPEETGCIGYELMRDLDFDVSGDGRTWSENNEGGGYGGYSLHEADTNAAYFPVDEDGAGGWLPIGYGSNPFAAVFDGNGYSIRNLAIHRNQTYVGLFGAIGGVAAIRNLGLVDNFTHSSRVRGSVFAGGLVGRIDSGSITASYAAGVVVGNDSYSNVVGGLVGRQGGGLITASYATGVADGGGGRSDAVGGLVGFFIDGMITASYATGAAAGGRGDRDRVGGLVGIIHGDSVGSITASYATGAVDGGAGADDSAGRLVGRAASSSITASYGFGATLGGEEEDGVSAGSEKPDGVTAASQLTADNAGSAWDDMGSNTLGAWDFGDDRQIPALNYADYDGEDSSVFACGQFPAAACGTLLPGQDEVSVMGPSSAVAGETVVLTGSLELGRASILSWSWRQLAGPTVTLSVDNVRETTFTAPTADTKEPLVFGLMATAADGRQYRERFSLAVATVDRDGNGLIEIDDLTELHNMRHNLAGTSYKSGAAAVDNSLGCPDAGCIGYELMRDLDFDADKDGRTWSGSAESGFRLDGGDSQAYYFPVSGRVGGWLPIGGEDDPFAAVFDGNGYTISNLAISRAQSYVGLFGYMETNAAIRNLGLVDNFAHPRNFAANLYVGGLVGQMFNGSITASYATGVVAGGSHAEGRAGGLVGLQSGGAITASYVTGVVDGGGGRTDYVGGLVGQQNGGSITASYATGVAAGGEGTGDYVGGLVGYQGGGSITASYATGVVDGGEGFSDNAGGLVGEQRGGSITASYATGVADGGGGGRDLAGGLVGRKSGGSITASYGFGGATGEAEGSAGSEKPDGVTASFQLTAANAGPSWNTATLGTRDAWDFGDGTQIPALRYADYDAAAAVFDCGPDLGHFPAGACGTLLPGQDEVIASSSIAVAFGGAVSLAGSLKFDRATIASWSWRQLAGPEVRLSNDDAREAAFTAPLSKEPMLFELTATDGDGRKYSGRVRIDNAADRDGNGLIEIDGLLDLHNMRHNLAGTGYKSGAAAVGNSLGCPEETGCMGYELMRDLDFDGDDDDGRTWSGNGADGYTLDSDDHRADYFPVDEDGAGGWLPIGGGDNPFAAVFDGNGHSISNLAIRRDQAYVGLFGAIGAAAAIRGLGLIDNLADYTGSSNDGSYIGGLAGSNDSGSITASWATGPAAGGDGAVDYVGGLVGRQAGGSITASYATGAATGGDGSFDYVGGLIGQQSGGSITASYATGAAAGGDGDYDRVGGLVGHEFGGSITASYAAGTVSGGAGDSDDAGALVGLSSASSSITESYGFGGAAGEFEGSAGSEKPDGVTAASQLTATNAGLYWDDPGRNTYGAWDFGDEAQIPALRYADYDGAAAVFDCGPDLGHFPADACGALLPGQDQVSASGPATAVESGDIVMLTGSLNRRGDSGVTIVSWSWRQLAGPEVELSGADSREATFTVPLTKEPWLFELTATGSDGRRYRDHLSVAVKADRDGDGLIEIDGLIELHNMRHNLAGTSYKASSTTSVGNSAGCPEAGCIGYELMDDLDFDASGDGRTWSGNGADGYTLDSDDRQADYFPVDEGGAGGWLPIGDGDNPFAAVFDGNGYSIRNLAIRREQDYVELFGSIGGDAAIRNLGLVDNLAARIGTSDDFIYVGGLVGLQRGGMITASYATGAAAGGGGPLDAVGGLVGVQSGGSITASYAAGPATGGAGDFDAVGGLVGVQSGGSITASYATWHRRWRGRQR